MSLTIRWTVAVEPSASEKKVWEDCVMVTGEATPEARKQAVFLAKLMIDEVLSKMLDIPTRLERVIAHATEEPT